MLGVASPGPRVCSHLSVTLYLFIHFFDLVFLFIVYNSSNSLREEMNKSAEGALNIKVSQISLRIF